MTVRTRFAPSPTGSMHIGNLRTALYEYLIAKSNNGQFVLRIEDTDQSRYVEGAVNIIYETLKIAGLQHDEGPDIGGEYGPYVQSERKNSYLPYAEQLIKSGHAYYCFCSKERLEKLKSEQSESGIVTSYDRHCTKLSTEESNNMLNKKCPYVIRQKIPQEGTTSFDDAVYGTITIENKILDDQVLIKSDGMPTYNFANVIDDHLMNITHVVRGGEYISSTPKYNLLYKSFGWDLPVYVHLPLITKLGGGKLAKRAGDTSFYDLLERGYLPEAIINYVALLGWSPGDEREFFTLDELTKAFDVKGISKSPAVFDIEKLNWMNGEYIRMLSANEFHTFALPYYDKCLSNKALDLKKLSETIQPRVEILSLIPESIGFLEKIPDYDIELYTHKKMKTNPQIAKDILSSCLDILENNILTWNQDCLHDALISFAKENNIKNGQMLWPLRIALSGKSVTPGGAIEILAVLGRDNSLKRINNAIIKLDSELIG